MITIQQAFKESKERALEVVKSIAQRYNVTTEKVLEAIEGTNCLRHFYLHAEDPKSVIYTFDSYSDGNLVYYSNKYNGRLYNLYANIDKCTSNVCVKGFVDINWNPYKKWVHTLFLGDEFEPKIEYVSSVDLPPYEVEYEIDNHILSLIKKNKLIEVWITNKYLIAEFSNFEIYYNIWDLPCKFAVPCIGEFLEEDFPYLKKIGFRKGVVSLEGKYRHLIGYPSAINKLSEMELQVIDRVKKLELNMSLKYQGDVLSPIIPKFLLDALEDVTIGFTPNFDLVLAFDNIYFLVPYKFELFVEEYEKGSDLHNYLIEMEMEEPEEEDDWWE